MATIKTVKTQSERIEAPYSRSYNIVAYGDDNLYPVKIQNIVNASSTGVSCLERYAEYIEGRGFQENVEIDESGLALNDLLPQLSSDLALFGGIAVHVNRNILGAITNITPLKFANCRLEEPNEFGEVKKIAVHPDWSGASTRAGKIYKVTKETIDYIDVFSNDLKVIKQQISDAGGIKNWKGQVLWLTLKENGYKYPICKADAIVTCLSTDIAMDNVKYHNAESNFLPAVVLLTKAVTEEQESRQDQLAEALSKFVGSDNAGGILHVNITPSEEPPEFQTIGTNNLDKDYTATNADTIERIYSRFGQEAFYSVRTSSAGFSGETQKQAEEGYCKAVLKEQKFICRAFKKLFDVEFNILPLYDTEPGETENNT